MSRTQTLRWKRKAVAVAVLSVAFAGYLGIGARTVSAGSDGGWDCSEIRVADNASSDECTIPTDETYPDDTYPDDTYPDDTYPDDTYPDDTYPDDTVPQNPPARSGVQSVAGAGLCANGSGTVNLTLSNNEGDLPVNFVVTHPVSGVSTTLSVPTSSSRQLTLLGTSVGTVHIRILVGARDLSRSFEVTCSDPVQPAVVSPHVINAPVVVAPQVIPAPVVLPATGSTSMLATLFIAIGLVGAGFVAITVARRNAGSRERQS